MKKSTTIILLLAFCQFIFSQKSQIETKLKDIPSKSIQGEKLANYDLMKHIKNKVVILEFWETWCGPCIKGMSHLKNLKDKFPNDLQVICISSDDIKKTTSFVKENSYSFDFIFDEQKKFSTIFPHSSIPHTVIIDKKGNIQAETYPGYITETLINQLIAGDSIDVPSKKNFKPTDLVKTENKSSLVLFDLQSTELGDRNYSSKSTTLNKKRIVTGYATNAFKDTVETIQQYTLAGKNILELYSFAYKDFPEFRFIFPKELNYIKSSSPNNLYRLNYSVSNLFGDFNSVLIRQLNASFNLETEKNMIDTTVLVLRRIQPNANSIKLDNDSKEDKSSETYTSYDTFELKGSQFSIVEIATLLENKTHFPVEFAKTDNNKYKLNISIKTEGETLENWLKLFEKEGLYLEKARQKIEFITIKKVCP